MLAGMAVLLALGRALDALTLGEDAAASLGIGLSRTRAMIVAGTALSVGAATAVTGIIGFVGLLVPHVLRPFAGHRPGLLLPASMLGGATFLLVADTGAAAGAAVGGPQDRRADRADRRAVLRVAGAQDALGAGAMSRRLADRGDAGLRVSLQGPRGAARPRRDRSAGSAHRRHRPQRRRQDDAAAGRSPASSLPPRGEALIDGRASTAVAAATAGARARLPAAGTHRALGAQRARGGRPGAPALSAAGRRRECRRRAAIESRARRHGYRPTCAAAPSSSSREERVRGCSSRARWPRSRARCWPTSPPQASTPHTSWRCSATSPHLRRPGRTVVVALHDLSLAARFCHSIVLVHRGRAFAAGPPQEVLAPAHLAAAYGITARYHVLDGVPVVLPLDVLP